jgi:hypothetical protein
MGHPARASDSDFNGRKADRDLGNLLAAGQPVFYVQPDGILDVVDSFFVRFALTVATLERRAGNEKAIGVCFNDDRKGNVLHDFRLVYVGVVARQNRISFLS